MTWKETTAPKTFTSQPEPPYLTIDFWQKGTDLHKCIKARTSAQAFNEDDWMPATPAEEAKADAQAAKADASDAKADASDAKADAQAAKDSASDAKTQAAAAQNTAIEAQTFYAASNTAAATAAKTTASEVEGFVLKTGVCVRVKFTYANTNASPSLSFSSTGAKAMRLNGAAYAYWQAGATIDFVYDGTYWQVVNVPIYGASSTIGNPAGGNVYTDGDGISIRKGTTIFARWTQSLIELGKGIASAAIDMLNGLLRIGAYSDGTKDWARIHSAKALSLTSATGNVSLTGLDSSGEQTSQGIGIIPNTDGGITGIIKTDNTEIWSCGNQGSLCDWVVLRYPSGSWAVEKWASGDVQCEMVYSFTATFSNAQSPIWWTNAIMVEFPTGLFSSPPHVEITAEGAGLLGAASINTRTKDYFSFYFYRFASSVSSLVRVHITAKN